MLVCVTLLQIEYTLKKVTRSVQMVNPQHIQFNYIGLCITQADFKCPPSVLLLHCSCTCIYAWYIGYLCGPLTLQVLHSKFCVVENLCKTCIARVRAIVFKISAKVYVLSFDLKSIAAPHINIAYINTYSDSLLVNYLIIFQQCKQLNTSVERSTSL